jgi:hypothetical protein
MNEQGPLSVIPAIVWRESSRIAVDARLRIAGMTIDGPKIQYSLAQPTAPGYSEKEKQ